MSLDSEIDREIENLEYRYSTKFSEAEIEECKNKRTSMGFSLHHGFITGKGLLPSDAEAYSLFHTLFEPVIKDYHEGFGPNTKQPKPDFGENKLNLFKNLDPGGDLIISTRIRCARSLEGYPFNVCLTKENYMAIEAKAKQAFELLQSDADLRGTYVSLEGMAAGMRLAYTKTWKTSSKAWKKGFAVAVKMNILLFAPALFLVLLLSNGFIETFWLLAIAALIQVLVALEFLSFDCVAYLSRAFELSRVFLFEWTVNWRFIPEAVFVDRRFHIALLAAHLSLLAVFALKFWFRSSGGLFNSLRKLLFGVRLRLDAHDILFALFSSNLVGMAFARSLHYQFYCWYYHSIPYLLFSPLYSPNNQIAHIRDGKKLTFSSKQIAVRLAIMLGIEFCWNVFPSTSGSSLLLHALHASVIVLSCRGPTSAHSPLKRR